jgi:acylphosphatase
MSGSAVHTIFTGQVQGVGFRFTALNIANRYQLTGMVRNMPDGSVEMIVQGPADDIDNCVSDIKKSFGGYIREIKKQEIPYDPQYKDFKITF